MAGEATVGSIIGFLRLNADQFFAELDKAERKAKELGQSSPSIDVHVDAAKAIAELEAVAVTADKVDRSNVRIGTSAVGAAQGLEKMGTSLGEVSSSGGGSPALLAAIAVGATLIGPAAGAATAAVAGLAGGLGVAALAYYGFKQELADSSGYGPQLQSEIDGITGSLDHLGSIAANSAGPGVIGALSQIKNYLGTLDGPVAGLASDLGAALNISAGGLISALDAMGPLMRDVGGYAKDFAAKFADFAKSQQFRDFLDYARQELPIVASTLWDTAQAFVNLAIAIAPFGDRLLNDLDVFAGAINDVAKASKFIGDINSLWGLLNFDKPADGADKTRKALLGASDAALKASDSSKAAAAGLKSTSDQAVVTYPIVDEFGNVLYDVNGKATDATTALHNLENSIRGLGNTALDVRANERQFQQAIDDATASAKKNGRTLNENTQAGRNNADVLDRIATTNHGVTAALIANHASQTKVNTVMREGRAAYIKAAEAMGASSSEAKRLADQAGFTAGDVRKVNDALREAGRLHPKPTITVRGADAAILAVHQVQSAIAALHDRSVTITTFQRNAFNKQNAMARAQADGGVMQFFANGGESHVAQIAPAGAMRVWAEPETGGEAYIPLAPAKRARSEVILSDVAERFGMSVQSSKPAAAAGVASGRPGRNFTDADIYALAGAMSRVQLNMDGRSVSRSVGRELVRGL